MYKITKSDIQYAENQAKYKHLKFPYIDKDELISAAYEGLVVASKTFNPNMGTKFTSYAYKAMDQQMKETVDFLTSNCDELLEVIDAHSVEEIDCRDYSHFTQEDVTLLESIIRSGLSIHQYAKENNIPDSTLYERINNMKEKVIGATFR